MAGEGQAKVEIEVLSLEKAREHARAIFFLNILLLETISRAITGVSLTLLAANDPMNSPPIHRAPWQVMS